MTRRLIALGAAGVTTLLAITLIGWVVFSGVTAPDPGAPIIDDLGPAPDIDEIHPGISATQAERVIDNAQDGQLTWMDPDDADRVASIIEYETLEPQPAGRMRIELPRAWMYTIGGMTIYVRADSASWQQPPGSNQPESGRFIGDVEIHVMDGRHEPGAGGLRDEDRLALVRLDSLSFDFVLGEVQTDSKVTVEAPGIDASFNGLKAIIDEANDRLASLRTGEGGRVLVTPSKFRERASSESEDDGRSGAGDTQSGARIEDMYGLLLSDQVLVDVDGSTLNADRLEVWARLIDGRLHPDAIASLATEQPGDGSSGGPGFIARRFDIERAAERTADMERANRDSQARAGPG